MEFGLLDFLIAYAIREMYHYTVDTSDTQMQIGTKITILIQKQTVCLYFHQSQSNQIYPKFTKTCERAGRRKISVLETHYFLLKLYKMICYVKSCFLRSLLFTILTILRLFSKISSPNTGCLDSLHPQRATLFIRLSAKNAANLISYRGVRRISA